MEQVYNLDFMRENLHKTKYKEDQWQLFKNFTRDLDDIRKTNVLDYIPQLEGEF